MKTFNFLGKYFNPRGWAVLLPVMLLLAACTGKEDVVTPSDGEENSHLSIDISCLTRGEDASDIETIESLRIILLDNLGKVKANDFINIQEVQQDNETELKQFQYTWDFAAPFGRYHLYVIANEESITDYEVEDYEVAYQDMTLTELLNSFESGISGMEELLNYICFKPDFTKLIALSCDYDIDFNSSNSQFEAYLVNVATKFDINISNYRNEQITFTSITLNEIADRNFLIANIDDNHKYVNGDYWIDWMKDVVADTNLHPDLDITDQSNDKINALWGWLTDYGMPRSASHSSMELIEADDYWTVSPSTGQTGSLPTPGELSKGPFYFPESKYIPDGKTSQTYTLNFEISQTDGSVKTFNKELGRIKTLFRNTYAVIDVEISRGVESIYVEVYPWQNKETYYGTVSPE